MTNENYKHCVVWGRPGKHRYQCHWSTPRSLSPIKGEFFRRENKYIPAVGYGKTSRKFCSVLLFKLSSQLPLDGEKEWREFMKVFEECLLPFWLLLLPSAFIVFLGKLKLIIILVPATQKMAVSFLCLPLECRWKGFCVCSLISLWQTWIRRNTGRDK